MSNIYKILTLVIALLFFGLSINAQQNILNNEKTCGTPDMTIEEGKKLPYYGNNAFLSHYVDSLTYLHHICLTPY